MGNLRAIGGRGAAVAALVCIVAAGPARAETITMNFDFDFSGRPVLSGTPLNVAYPSHLFSFGADDVVRRTGDGVPSLPNFAGDDRGAPIDIIFTRPISGIQASNVTHSHWTLLAFGESGQLLGSVAAVTFREIAGLRFDHQIARAQFLKTPGSNTFGYGIDDLQIDVAPVPEPSSLLLLGTGALGLFRAARRRRDGDNP